MSKDIPIDQYDVHPELYSELGLSHRPVGPDPSIGAFGMQHLFMGTRVVPNHSIPKNFIICRWHGMPVRLISLWSGRKVSRKAKLARRRERLRALRRAKSVLKPAWATIDEKAFRSVLATSFRALPFGCQNRQRIT